jgi:alcohol dehydrogenase (cytochrome c)
MKRFITVATLLTSTVAVAVLLGTGITAQQDAPRSFTPVTDAMLQDPDPADWLMWRRTLDTWGYSPLDQVNRDNVGALTLVWGREMAPGLQEGTPLVHDGVLYMPNPLDVIQAMDAVSGDLLWEYRRELPDDLTDYFPVPAINRNLAIYDNLIIDATADDYMIALNAETGELVWETLVEDYTRGSQQTSGPIIANGKVVSGRGCEPEGGPDACVITAHDPLTGEELWRTRTMPRPDEPGGDTWGDVPDEGRWHVGSWMVPSYDPELNLIFTGTSVTSPAPKFMLGGNDEQHLYHNSTLALNADTGEIVWHYQHVVDHWDLDHPYQRILLETTVAPDPDEVTWINPNIQNGESRKVVTGIPGKTGVFYTLDAATGEFLWARPTVYQNVIADIDGTTGKVTVNPETLMHAAGDAVYICPGVGTAKNWESGSYSPLTGMIYYALGQNTCAMITATLDGPSLDSLYGIRMDSTALPPGVEETGNLGTVQAFSAETGRTEWVYEQRAATMSLLATGGRLVFGGDVNGRFRALDDVTGELLWEINLGRPVTGFPITYSTGNRQFIAVSTGSSLTMGGRLALTPELRPSTGNSLFVFALPNQD